MKIFFISLAFVMYWSNALSQEYRISGNVENTENAPILYANVLLRKISDSTILKGTSTDENGKFYIDDVASGRYFLTASYIKNTSDYLTIDVVADTNVGTLLIDETAARLDEVVVTFQKPTLERKVDRLVFNVANTALSDGTIWDLLKHTPSVSDFQGVLTVKGNSDITVMINSRKVNLPKSDIINLLSGASASSVESIEVITNPPSKYSAEGGILIDIKMSKNLSAGYNGAVFNQYRQGVFAKHTLGTDHYFKGKKGGFSVNYSYNNDKSLTRYTDITNYVENDGVSSIWTANQDGILRRKRHNLSAFFDYQINEKNALSFSTINTFNPKVDQLDDSKTIIDDINGIELSSFNTINVSDKNQINTSFYGDWIHKLKKKSAEISVGSHYTFYDSDMGQDLQTDFFDLNGDLTGENNFTTLSQQKINLYSLQADYSSPIGKYSQLETGLRYAGVQSRNTIEQEGFDRNQPGTNPIEAGTFDYDESIYAAYISFNGKWNQWRLRSGLRAEQTETLGKLDTDPAENKNSYLEVFPSLSLQYLQGDKHEYSFRYYRRIARPRYNDINPFQYFESNNVITEGNPDLLPSIATRFAAGYTYDNSYTLEFIYDNTANKLSKLVFQDNEANLLRYISSNLESSYSYGLDFTFNKDITNFWNSYVLATYFFKKDGFIDLTSGQLLENSQGTWILNTYQSFTVLKDKSLFIDLNFFYRSPIVNGNNRIDEISRLGLTFRKNFWNKKASISLGVTDIFNQGNVFSTRQFLDQNNATITRPENRLFTFAFRYKFGNTGIKTNKKRKRVDERNRI